MPRKIPRLLWLAVPLAYFLFFYGLDATGLLGPDEPRYASIAREMARSGDWVTPRLWGEPWFEKPALLYWMGAAGFRFGLGPELAPRLPVAAIGLAFLAFFWWIARREFGSATAWFAILILGSCAAWIGYTHVAVTDIPLTAAFSAAMLLALPWVARRDQRLLPAAGAMLGLAALAKGLVPLALAAPLAAVIVWRRSPGAAVRIALPCLAVALPWYLAVYAGNGRLFLDEFFFKHHFGRFTNDALKHVQPWWFYGPVLVGLLAPWSALLPLMFGRPAFRDPRRLFALGWLFFGLLVFSISVNKLPGYLLPLLPPAALLMAAGLNEARNARICLAACALPLAAYALAAPVLGPALADGLSRAPLPTFGWTWIAPVGIGVAAWIFEARKRRLEAVMCIVLGVAGGIALLRARALPEVDRLASARGLWREIAALDAGVCVDDLHRRWRYGLNYYSVAPLPECVSAGALYRVRQGDGEVPKIELNPPRQTH